MSDSTVEENNTVLLERDGRVAILTINRPDKLNALNHEVGQALLAHLVELEKDDDIGVVVLTGSGDKAFVAGADIPEFVGRSPFEERQAMAFPRMFDVAASFPKPVIAMINGFCLGGGCEVALSCDIRIASDQARFGQPEIKLGLIPGGGGTQRLPRLIGVGQTLRLVLTGDMLDAGEALSLGLVEQVIPHAELRARTLELASRIAAMSPLTLKIAKEAIRASERLNLEEGIRYERDLFCLLFSTRDKDEGVSAFLEKRAPEWSGT